MEKIMKCLKLLTSEQEKKYFAFLSLVSIASSVISFLRHDQKLPTALVVAQELETNNQRYNFAHTLAMGNSISPSRTTPIIPYRR